MSPIGFGCITSAKYDQKATLLRQGYASDAPAIRPAKDTEDDNYSGLEGGYEMVQHPVTGQIERVWVPAKIPVPGAVDDPTTTGEDEREDLQVFRFECQARPIITGGLNSQGTTERWTTKGTYENVDFIEVQFPANIVVTKRDRITNITDSRGNVIWREEEHGSFKPTIFDVQGVAPSLDPFGSVIEYFALCKRAESQNSGSGAN